MSYHDRALDQLMVHVLRSRRCGCGRRSCRCGGRRFEAAAAPPRPSPPIPNRPVGAPSAPARPAGLLCLEDWAGWSNGVVLADLLAAGRYLDQQMRAVRAAHPTTAMLSQIPPGLRPYFSRGLRLYRIQVRGQRNPVDIGMVVSTPPGFRLMRHFLPAAAILSPAIRNISGRFGRLRRLVRDDANAVVHLGRFRRPLRWGRTGDRRVLHAYEIILQRQERTQTYNPRTWTFED